MGMKFDLNLRKEFIIDHDFADPNELPSPVLSSEGNIDEIDITVKSRNVTHKSNRLLDKKFSIFNDDLE